MIVFFFIPFAVTVAAPGAVYLLFHRDHDSEKKLVQARLERLTLDSVMKMFILHHEHWNDQDTDLDMDYFFY